MSSGKSWWGVAIAVAGAGLGTLLVRSPLGDSGLAAVVGPDGVPVASTAPFLAGAWLAAAASGTWFGTGRRDDPDSGVAPAVAVGVTLGLLAPTVLGVAGMATGPMGRLLLAVLGLELSVTAGVAVGLTVARRRPELGPAIVAGAVGLLLILAARFVLVGSLSPGRLIGPTGQLTAGALGALRAQERWLPIAAGGAAAVAGALGAFTSGRTAWLALVGLSPLLLCLAGLGVELIGAGTAVLSATPALEWLYVGVGGTLGAAVGLLMPTTSDRGRLRPVREAASAGGRGSPGR